MARKQPVKRSRNARRGGSNAPPDSARSREIVGILGLGAAIFVVAGLLSLQLGSGNLVGPFGRSIAVVFYAVFGLPAYIVVVGLALISLRLLTDRQPIACGRHVLGLGLGLIALATLLHLAASDYRVDTYAPGGVIGETLAEVFRAVVSTVGTALLASIALVLAVVIATPLRVKDVLGAVGRGVVRGANTAAQVVWQWTRDGARFVGEVVRALLPERDRDDYLEEDTTIMSDFDEPAFVVHEEDEDDEEDDEDEEDEEDEEEASAAGPDEEPAVVVGEVEGDTTKMSAESIVALIADAEQAKKGRKSSSGKKAGKSKKNQTLPGVGGSEQSPGEEADAADTIIDLVDRKKPDKQPLIVESKFKSTDAAEMKRKEKEADKRRGYIPLGDGDYQLPPVTLLDYDESRASGIDKAAMLELSARLIQTLEHYKIKGEVTAIRPGPVVTMYEFAPAPGTRLSKIESLSDELAMALEAERVRIVAPIPGKGVVGIEVPNRAREIVYLKEIIADDVFQAGKLRLPLALGKTIEGAPTVVDLAKMPHLLVAGTTGSGKSVSINSMITSLLYNSSPEDIRMIMVDPKMLELSIYEGIPHLLLPVVTDPKKANLALRWAVEEMEHRYQLLSEMRVRDIASYNKKVAKVRMEWEAERLRAAADEAERLADDFEGEVTEEQLELPMDEDSEQPPKKLPFIVIVIDEFADLMMCAPKEVETSVARIAQKARAAGIHLILATQRPSVNVITGLIKANFPSRVAFRVAQKVDSRTILDQGGAEALLGSGDMLFSDRGANPSRLHGCFVGDSEITRIVDHLKEQGKPVYNLDILKPRDDEGGDAGGSDEPADEKYDLAVQIVAETQRVSISYLQRRLGIGYNRAAKIVERMERDEVVGPPDSRNVREVLISAA